MAEEKRKRILSGIQPTGTPTLGNYIGAVRNSVSYTHLTLPTTERV